MAIVPDKKFHYVRQENLPKSSTEATGVGEEFHLFRQQYSHPHPHTHTLTLTPTPSPSPSSSREMNKSQEISNSASPDLQFRPVSHSCSGRNMQQKIFHFVIVPLFFSED